MKLIKTSDPREIEWLERKHKAISVEKIAGTKKGEETVLKTFSVEEDVIVPAKEPEHKKKGK
jgi:hypothetical protein